MISTNTHYRNIHSRIHSYQARVKLASIGQRYPNTASVLDYVGICEDLSIGGKDETRANTTPKFRSRSIATPAHSSPIYINPHHRRTDSFRSGCYRSGVSI